MNKNISSEKTFNFEIMVNGEPVKLEQSISVKDLLVHLEISSTGLAVERNRSIVPKSDYDKTMLTGGDEIEIVTFMGGG